jgi:hypothetical protein
MGKRAVVLKYLPEITRINSPVASRAGHKILGFDSSLMSCPLFDVRFPRNYTEFRRHQLYPRPNRHQDNVPQRFISRDATRSYSPRAAKMSVIYVEGMWHKRVAIGSVSFVRRGSFRRLIDQSAGRRRQKVIKLDRRRVDSLLLFIQTHFRPRKKQFDFDAGIGACNPDTGQKLVQASNNS